MIGASLVAATQDTSVNILSLNVTFVVQAALFLLLLGILSKWVYPPIVSASDRRLRRIDEDRGATDSATREVRDNQRAVTATLDEARAQAGTVLGEAQRDATAAAGAVRQRARDAALASVQEARTGLAKEGADAAGALHDQVAALVIAAADRVGGVTLDAKTVARAIDEVRG